LVPPGFSYRRAAQVRHSPVDLSLLPIFGSAQDLTMLTQIATGVRNAHASVWKKTQASLDDCNQTSDQKIDV
jgi:hypothetical protein